MNKNIFENKNEYIKPECQALDVDFEQMIAVSGESGTESYTEENYNW